MEQATQLAASKCFTILTCIGHVVHVLVRIGKTAWPHVATKQLETVGSLRVSVDGHKIPHIQPRNTSKSSSRISAMTQAVVSSDRM